MKKIKKTLIMISVFVMCLLSSVPVSAAVKMSSKSLTLISGQSKTLKVTGTKSKITWSSSKRTIASVTSKGKVTAKKTGTATITANIGKKKYICKVKVETPKISNTNLSIASGETETLKIFGTTQKVSWKSSNKKIATVTSKGKVKGIKTGSCKITATVCGKKYTCSLKVTAKSKKIPVITFSLAYYNIMLKEGETEEIGTYIYPSDSTNKSIKWSSSNESIATVNSSGFVTGISIGKATITAICDGKKATCDVEVTMNFDEQEAKNSITYTSYKTNDGIVVIAKNNYKYTMLLEANCVYYNMYGTMIGATSDNCIALESGKECALLCINPYDSNYRDVMYNRYTINFNVRESSNIIGNSSSIVCIGNFGAENVMINVSNHGEDVSSTLIAVIFYKNGQAIGYDCKYAKVNTFGSSDYLQFDFPYDSEYNTIYPDDFKIYVNNSYRYNWE